MLKSTQIKQANIDSFLNEENKKRALVEEVMGLAQAVAEQDPDRLDELVDSIVPVGWEPTLKS